jgi:hypothetical protein
MLFVRSGLLCAIVNVPPTSRLWNADNKIVKEDEWWMLFRMSQRIMRLTQIRRRVGGSKLSGMFAKLGKRRLSRPNC